MSAPVQRPPEGDAAAETLHVDEVLDARNREAAELLAGLIAAAQLDTVGTPSKLPRDEFPDVDPEIVQRIWDRALVVGMRAAELKRSPYFYRDKLERLQGELTAAGYAAMGGSAARVLSGPGAYPELHAVDDEGARGH